MSTHPSQGDKTRGELARVNRSPYTRLSHYAYRHRSRKAPSKAATRNMWHRGRDDDAKDMLVLCVCVRIPKAAQHTRTPGGTRLLRAAGGEVAQGVWQVPSLSPSSWEDSQAPKRTRAPGRTEVSDFTPKESLALSSYLSSFPCAHGDPPTERTFRRRRR